MDAIRGVIGRVALSVAIVVPIATASDAPNAGATSDGGSFVAATASPDGHGLYRLDRDGGVHVSGSATFLGSIPQRRQAGQSIPAVEAVDLAPTATGNGYWIFDAVGGVHAFGDAVYRGSIPELRARGQAIGRARAIAAAVSPSGSGYWILDADGGIFPFGDARFHGSVPGLRDAGQRIGPARAVDLAVTPSGAGYVVLDSDGGVFTFGDAGYFGSIPALRAAGQPIGRAEVRDIVMASDGRGYWITDAAGGIFTFGQASFHGSAPGRGQPFSLSSTAVVPSGDGYWMMNPHGQTLAFGSVVPGARSTSTAHAFLGVAPDGRPVGFNPCRTLEYVVHLGDGAPAGARSLAADAFARLAAATGIDFVDAGTTSERFSRQYRPWWGHTSYGARYSPILVSFEAPDSTNQLGGQTGLASRQMATNDAGRTVTVSGSIAVSTAAGLTADFGQSASYGAVLLHELGHLAGLDHVDDRSQLMAAVLRAGGPGTYQAGDRAGLARLGRDAGCLNDPRP